MTKMGDPCWIPRCCFESEYAELRTEHSFTLPDAIHLSTVKHIYVYRASYVAIHLIKQNVHQI